MNDFDCLDRTDVFLSKLAILAYVSILRSLGIYSELNYLESLTSIEHLENKFLHRYLQIWGENSLALKLNYNNSTQLIFNYEIFIEDFINNNFKNAKPSAETRQEPSGEKK